LGSNIYAVPCSFGNEYKTIYLTCQIPQWDRAKPIPFSLFADYNLITMPITTVLFDLGSTLIYSKNPWLPIFEQADRALVEVLQRGGIVMNSASFYADFDTFLDNYYAQRGTGTVEITTSTSLAELLARKGFRNVPGAVIRDALDAMYAVTQKNWVLEDDAIPTLEILWERGYRLGMISNTSDDKNVQQLVDLWGLRSYFEFIVTSAGCGVRKPDERIFRLALDHFEIPPEATAMVGDTLEADILGANQIGIYSTWVTRRVAGPDPSTGLRRERSGERSGRSSPPIQPDATVSTLSAIPSILAAIA
jgi:putative hydrolase of the HAD superfamily